MRWALGLGLLTTAAIATGAWAAEAGTAKADKAKPEVVACTLHPAAPTRPALRHRLTPRFWEQTPGNAAPLYLKAFLLLSDAKIGDEAWDKIAKWLQTPLADLPRDEVRKTLEPASDALRQVAMATRRTDCDWAQPIREEENPFTIVLPELVRARSAARLLAVRVRLAIAEKRFDAAMEDMTTGFALARHAAAAPILVNGLVGLAIAGMMEEQLQTLVQQGDVPNLYWTLTALPCPIADLRQALEAEGEVIDRLFPEVAVARKTHYSEQQWYAVLKQVADRMGKLIGLEEDVKAESAMARQILMATLDPASAPAARADLIQRGWMESAVKQMSPSEVVLTDTLEVYYQHRDELFKWFYVPYWQAEAGVRQAETVVEEMRNELDPQKKTRLVLPGLMLPAIGSCIQRVAESQRGVAALRTIEAIRAYAAEHDGKLPASLDAIQGLPVPTNPVTGKAFPYRLEGKTAVLTADGGRIDKQVEYRLTVAN